LGDDAQARGGVRVADSSGWQPAVQQRPHTAPGQMITLTATPQHSPPQATDRATEGADAGAIHGYAVVTDMTENDRAQVGSNCRDGMGSCMRERSSAFTACSFACHL
jgi:hypothetical protein